MHDTNNTDYGYIHHGEGTNGPFMTQRVAAKMQHPFNWYVQYEGRWRKVHVKLNKVFIIYKGEKLTVQIEGV